MTITVEAYSAAWAVDGAALAVTLAGALGPLALRVEHIGSTSVPGMAAKPILDMQVSVADLDEAAAAFDGPLAALGITRKPYLFDHVPAGVDDDERLWAKRYWNRPGELSVHCRLAGSPNERLALLFRDWMRAHPLAVAGYSRFKQRLAVAVDGIGTYTDTKDPVIDVIIVAAEEWAAATGWRP